MRIAICDDNIADRKQTERLMGREAAWWIKEEKPMYMDSFGNAESILATPMLYDAFLIDVCHTLGTSTMIIVEQLKEKGVTAPIILCSSDVDYHAQDFGEDILFLDKPISTKGLHDMMLHVESVRSAEVSHIELRTIEKTHYVTAEEIMYAEAMDSTGSYTRVTLKDGTELQVNGSVVALFTEIKGGHTTFVMCSQNSIINVLYVSRFKWRSVIMTDDAIFPAHGYIKTYIKLLHQWLLEHPGTLPTEQDIAEI